MPSPLKCRTDCGACCIAPSISTPIPGMPKGKPSGQACIQLTDNYQCKIFGQAQRPKVCSDFKPCLDVCGESRQQALENLYFLEKETK